MAQKKKKTLMDGLQDLTENEAEMLRKEIARRRTTLKKKDVAAENRRAARFAQKETDDQALQEIHERIKKLKEN